MSDLKRYILAKPWEVKAGVVIETAQSVLITENRAEQLINAGIIDAEVKGAIKKAVEEAVKKSNMKPKK